nr:unnamed protein product [Spirometra erinaceieuropaei]
MADMPSSPPSSGAFVRKGCSTLHRQFINDPQRLRLLPGGVSSRASPGELTPPVKRWSLSDFDIGKNLGKGRFGSIMFKLHFSTPETMQQLQREIEIQSHLK